MTVFTYSQARQNLATLLDLALRRGGVLIQRKDGNMFTVTKASVKKSPLDVPSVRVNIQTAEIVKIIREAHSR